MLDSDNKISFKCPYCQGTGIQVIQPLPFEEDPIDSDIRVRAAKSMVNCLFKWKGMGTDRQGNVYVAEEHIVQLAHAVAVLESCGIINAKQNSAIIKYLMTERTDAHL